MKKLIMMAVAAIMATTSVNAQSYEPSKHEIGISYGVAPTTDVVDVVGHALVTGFSGGQLSYSNERNFGAISVEYFYRVNKIIGLGGILNYSYISRDLETNRKKDGESTTNLFTVMPAAKFNWIDKKHFGLYSKAAIGVTFDNKKDKLYNGNSKSESSTRFNFQASVIGADFGAPTIRAFVELGFGQQGLVVLGARYKF